MLPLISIVLSPLLQNPEMGAEGFLAALQDVRSVHQAACQSPPMAYLVDVRDTSMPATDEQIRSAREYFDTQSGLEESDSHPLFSDSRPWRGGRTSATISIIEHTPEGGHEAILWPPNQAGKTATIWDFESSAIAEIRLPEVGSPPLVSVFQLMENSPPIDIASHPDATITMMLKFAEIAVLTNGIAGSRSYMDAHEWEVRWTRKEKEIGPSRIPVHPCFPWIGGDISLLLRSRIVDGLPTYDLVLCQKDINGMLLSKTEAIGLSERAAFETVSEEKFYPGVAIAYSKRQTTISAIDSGLEFVGEVGIPAGSMVTDWRLDDFEWKYAFDKKLPTLKDVVAARDSLMHSE